MVVGSIRVVENWYLLQERGYLKVCKFHLFPIKIVIKWQGFPGYFFGVWFIFLRCGSFSSACYV